MQLLWERKKKDVAEAADSTVSRQPKPMRRRK